MVSKQQLIDDLIKIGVCRGDHVAVSLSLKSIGYVQGGPNTFIDALLEAVGPKGTIMMNTYTHAVSLFALTPDFMFDSKKTIPNTGLVPKTLLRKEEAIRSKHPITSVAAIGYFAKFLTKDHDGRSNPFLPYEKLGQINGKYLCIGVGNRLVAIRHQAQRRAKLFRAPIFLGAYYKRLSGKRGLYVRQLLPCVDNLHSIVPKVEEKIHFKRGKVGLADSILVDAEELIETMAQILKQNPELGLCDRILCFKCREFERHHNLYSKIEKPRFFQRNIIARTALFGLNKLILSQFRYAIVCNSEDNKIIKKKVLDFAIEIMFNIALRLLRKKKTIELKSFKS